MTASKSKLGAIVLAAGRSTRFGGERPKVLHPLWGRPLVGHVLEALREVHRKTRLQRVCLVVSPGKQVERALADISFPFEIVFATQRRARGTGDAARVGLKAVGALDEVLVLAGDAPLVRAPSLVELVERRREDGAAGALLTAVLTDGGPYGRIVREGEWITGVVETRDATSEQLAIREINTCTYAFAREALEATLPELTTDNDQQEYLLTDVPALLFARGGSLAGVEGDPSEVLGANTRSELATASTILRRRLLTELMSGGVTVVDPDATYVDAGVKVGADTVLLPGTFLEGTTKVGKGCVLGPNTRLVDTTVGDGASVTFAVAREARIGAEAEVGPFASLRPGTVLRKGAKAGTFAEMKNADIGEGAKVPHFSYLGDVSVGSGSNIGAGTVTCNYDGTDKHRTSIGQDAFVGSDSILVAPVRVGRGAYTGAGSVVTRDVKAGEVVYGVPARRRERSAGRSGKGSAGGKGKGKAKGKAKGRVKGKAAERPADERRTRRS